MYGQKMLIKNKEIRNGIVALANQKTQTSIMKKLIN